MHELLSKMNICKNLVIIDCATLEAIWKGNTNLLELLLNKNGFECERLCDEYNDFNFLLWPLFIDWLNALKHDGEFELYYLLYVSCGAIFLVWLIANTWMIMISRHLPVSVMMPSSFLDECCDVEVMCGQYL